MAVLDKPGVVLVTRMVYVAVTVVLLRVVALLVTVGAIPVTTLIPRADCGVVHQISPEKFDLVRYQFAVWQNLF